MLKTVPFNSSLPHIYLNFSVTDLRGVEHIVKGILDTGAPQTEFSDETLGYLGFLNETRDVSLNSGLQTQKYDIIQLPALEICGWKIIQPEVFVSYFEPGWGIDALIGLDFFANTVLPLIFMKELFFLSHILKYGIQFFDNSRSSNRRLLVSSEYNHSCRIVFIIQTKKNQDIHVSRKKSGHPEKSDEIRISKQKKSGHLRFDEDWMSFSFGNVILQEFKVNKQKKPRIQNRGR